MFIIDYVTHCAITFFLLHPQPKTTSVATTAQRSGHGRGRSRIMAAEVEVVGGDNEGAAVLATGD